MAPRLNVALWNLSVGIAAAGCQPLYTSDHDGYDERDTDSTNLTEDSDLPPFATSDPDDAECDPACPTGTHCSNGACVPDYDDCPYDYNDYCCIEGCDPQACYASTDCDAGEFCVYYDYYYYNACETADELPACVPDHTLTRVIPLPDAFVGGALALAFGDAEAGGGEELLAVRGGEAVVLTEGGASFTQSAAIEGSEAGAWAVAVALESGDGFAVAVPDRGTRLVTLDAGVLSIGPESANVLEQIGSGDFDGDGLGDVAGLGDGNDLAWLPGTGSGFEAATELASNGGGPLAIGDFDDDGRDDVAYSDGWDFARYVGDLGGAAVDRQVGAYDFDDHTLAAGDFDGDGLSDVMSVTGQQGVMMLLAFRNRAADPYFDQLWPMQAPDLVEGAGYRVATGDVDGDGIHDLVIGGDSVVRVVFGNLGLADSFPFRCYADVPIEHAATAIAVGYFDGDGRADVAFSDGAVTTVLAQF